MPSPAEVRLDQWRDLLSLADLLDGYIFRGQALASWPLSTRLERLADACSLAHFKSPILEHELLTQCRKKFHIYTADVQPLDSSMFSWLAIMHHYGIPTRLLDFSHSIFVALYFALLPLSSSEDFAIWAVNLVHFTEDDTALQAVLNHQFRMTAHPDDADLYSGKVIIPARSPNPTADFLSQQGVFLVHLDLDERFEESLKKFLRIKRRDSEYRLYDLDNLKASRDLRLRGDYSDASLSLIKIVGAGKHRKAFLKSLLEIGVTAELLYPNLNGLAKSLTEMIITRA